MIIISVDGIHDFRKQNIVTEEDSKGQYDLLKCTKCGVKGKCRNLRDIQIDGRLKIKAERCDKTKSEHEADQNTLEYKYGKDTKRKCPNCKGELRIISEWMLEGTKEICLIKVVCENGHLNEIEI